MVTKLTLTTTFFLTAATGVAQAATFVVTDERDFITKIENGAVQGGDTVLFAEDFDVFTRQLEPSRFDFDNPSSEAIIIDGQNDLTFTGFSPGQNYFDFGGGAFVFRNLAFDNIQTNELFSTDIGSGARITLDNATVSNVTSSFNMFGITSGASLTIRDSDFTGNTTVASMSSTDPLELIFNLGTTDISNTGFSGNDVRSVILSRGQLKLNKVAIENNTTAREALAIACTNTPGEQVGYDINSSRFSGNTGGDATVSANCIGLVDPNSISDSLFEDVSDATLGPPLVRASDLVNVTIGDETFNPTVIPLPAGFWLMLSGLGLMVFRRAA